MKTTNDMVEPHLNGIFDQLYQLTPNSRAEKIAKYDFMMPLLSRIRIFYNFHIYFFG